MTTEWRCHLEHVERDFLSVVVSYLPQFKPVMLPMDADRLFFYYLTYKKQNLHKVIKISYKL